MHADSHFAIGKTHKVCQDYAASGKAGGRAFASVSDGCSSSPDTDFGSRLLTRAAVALIPERLNSYRAVQDADTWRRTLGLSHLSLDATLLALFERADGNIGLTASGDGLVAARRKDGTFEWWLIEFLPGESGRSAPGYLSYLLDPFDRLKTYLTSGYSTRRVTRFVQRPGQSPEERENVVEPLHGQPEVNPAVFVYEMTLVASEYDFVAVCSDGVQSFQTKDSQGRVVPVALPLVLAEVLAIKRGEGDFITRRVNRFLTRFCEQNGWWHHDDFSMAAIWCGEV